MCDLCGTATNSARLERVRRRIAEEEAKQEPLRPDWDEYFIRVAEAIALRADCSRRRVGAVVVNKRHRIVSTGYNGSAPSDVSCLAGQCPRAQSDVEPGSSYDSGPGSCIAVHAEANALLYAGVDAARGGTIYVTSRPCLGCLRLIMASQVDLVYSAEDGSLQTTV